ncbi:Protein CBG17463 [Caenorhabditis briggsae]|uniref:Protein CBG17463 n=1 Tax=Caenorhabditis briggsae TaxID=6238 RepID=A8XR51_CAEBR|nr:Protein CBG17463 [Caenorhabditis briggsae]CAP35124.1 Protein CBG17463 [Caenorhabditis briggsae]
MHVSSQNRKVSESQKSRHTLVIILSTDYVSLFHVIRTMKLSKIPYLVQKEILDNMKYSDLFWLSFVSENMKTLIKSSQVKRFRNIGRVVYESFCDKPIASIHFMTKNKQGTEDVPKKENIIGVFCDYKESEDDCFQLNVSGKVIDFRLSHYYSFPEACFHRHDKEYVIESIHMILWSIFGKQNIPSISFQIFLTYHCGLLFRLKTGR